MDKKYYEEYFHLERNHWFFTARLKILESMIRKQATYTNASALKILNIGVATGATSEMLEQFGEVTSVEYDKDCCVLLIEKTNIIPVNASILDLPFPDQNFDLICCFDVIDHVDDHQAAMNEMFRTCKTNGHLFITVPAFMFLWSHHDQVNHHFRRYNRRSLYSLINTLPHKMVFMSYFNFLLFLPIAFYRLTLSKLKNYTKNQGAGSDFEVLGNSKAINALFYSIFIAENSLLKAGRSLPFGVSLMAWLQKTTR